MQFHKQRSAELLASTWLQSSSSSSSFNPFYSSSPKVSRYVSSLFSLFNYFENEPQILDLKIIQISSAVTRVAVGAGGLGFDSRAGQFERSVANGSPPLRSFLSCVVQAPGRGDGPRHSLRASAQ